VIPAARTGLHPTIERVQTAAPATAGETPEDGAGPTA